MTRLRALSRALTAPPVAVAILAAVAVTAATVVAGGLNPILVTLWGAWAALAITAVTQHRAAARDRREAR